MSHVITLIDMGDAVHDLARDLSRWSQETFGPDDKKGPLGAVRHLKKEAEETEAALLRGGARAEVTVELADCLILVYDAARRHGVKPLELHKAAYDKLQVNKKRTWPKPDPENPDRPVEHIREEANCDNEGAQARVRENPDTTI